MSKSIHINFLPKVSVLMTSYNYERYVEKAIRSIWIQNYPNMGLIIVDDGSSDSSPSILNKLKKESPIEMTIIIQKNQGPSKALNRALEEADGEIIALLASDDEMLPERLNQEIPYFLNNPELKVLYSSGQFISDKKVFGNVHNDIKKILKSGVESTRALVLRTAPGFYNQAMLAKRDFLFKIGGLYDGTNSDDWSINIRIFKALNEREFQYIDRYAFLYRLHGDQVHRINSFMQPMKRNVVRKYFTLENRSKYTCQNFVKQAFKLCLKQNFRHASRYIRKARYISFSVGFPIRCLLQFSFALPQFVFREITRQLKVKK